MSLTQEQGWVHLFHDQIRLTYQQMESLVKSRIDPKWIHNNVRAAKDYFDRMGNVVAREEINPFGQTVPLNPVRSRRATTPRSFNGTVYLSDEHTLRSMTDGQNEYRDTIVASLVRAGDKVLLAAAIGSAETATITAVGAAITAGTTVLPAGQKTGTGIATSLAGIIICNLKLSKGAVPSGAGKRLAFYSPGQLTDIMAITQASSSDFTKNQIHDKGTIDGLMWQGFTWVEIPDVINPDTTLLDTMIPMAGAARSMIFMARDAIGLTTLQDIETKISPRPDINDAIQVRSVMKLDAVRLFEGGVVQYDVLEN
jgi:hypothetical protein